MCDTFVALADVTSIGAVIFGKNSDRLRGETQGVVLLVFNTVKRGALVT